MGGSLIASGASCPPVLLTRTVYYNTGVGKMRLVRLRPVRLGPRVICV